MNFFSLLSINFSLSALQYAKRVLKQDFQGKFHVLESFDSTVNLVEPLHYYNLVEEWRGSGGYPNEEKSSKRSNDFPGIND